MKQHTVLNVLGKALVQHLYVPQKVYMIKPFVLFRGEDNTDYILFYGNMQIKSGPIVTYDGIFTFEVPQINLSRFGP